MDKIKSHKYSKKKSNNHESEKKANKRLKKQIRQILEEYSRKNISPESKYTPKPQLKEGEQYYKFIHGLGFHNSNIIGGNPQDIYSFSQLNNVIPTQQQQYQNNVKPDMNQVKSNVEFEKILKKNSSYV